MVKDCHTLAPILRRDPAAEFLDQVRRDGHVGSRRQTVVLILEHHRGPAIAERELPEQKAQPCRWGHQMAGAARAAIAHVRERWGCLGPGDAAAWVLAGAACESSFWGGFQAPLPPAVAKRLLLSALTAAIA